VQVGDCLKSNLLGVFCVAQQLAELQLALALPPARGGDACVCLALQTWACVVAGVLALAVGGWPLAFALTVLSSVVNGMQMRSQLPHT